MRLDDYERLEFLGDSVLNYLIAKFFFLSTQYDQERKMPKELHKMKTAVINNTLLSLIVIEYGIYEHIIYNKKAVAFKEQFDLLAKNTDLRSVCVFEEGKINEQSGEIYFGTDLVIGTAQRILEIYFERNLNLNKIKLFVIDDAQMMIKNSWQGQVDRLALSLPKCQHLVFSNELNSKIEKLISKFILNPIIFNYIL